MIRFLFRIYTDTLAGNGLGRVPGIPGLLRKIGKRTGLATLGRWALLQRPVVASEGIRLYLDPHSSSAPWLGKQLNIMETGHIRRILDPGDVAIDVGANNGFFSVLFGTLVGKTGKVFAFEPVAANIRVLKRNLSLNKLDNAVVFEVACGAENRSGAIYFDGNLSTARLTSGETGEAVSVVTVDSVLPADTGPVRFMKIDVEGAELFVLEGARETIERSPDIELLVEYNEDAFREFGYEGKSILDFFSERGFEAFDVRRDTVFAGGPGTTNVLFRRARADLPLTMSA